MATPAVEGSEAVTDVPTADAPPKITLTAREQEILMAAWLSIKGPDPPIDYERLAQILKSKNAHSANTIFYNVKKKIKQFRDENGIDVEAPSPPVKAAKPRKRAAKDPATPKSSRGKRLKKEASTPKAEEQEENKETMETTMVDVRTEPELENAV